jgi:hypothetical protein
MKSTGTFIGVLATSKLGTGSAACPTNALITFQKHGEMSYLYISTRFITTSSGTLQPKITSFDP